MKSLNRVTIIGNLGETPELRKTGSGQDVTNFTVATSNEWRGSDGNLQESTDWHKVVVWGSRAGNCVDFLEKGSRVYIEGRLETRSRGVNGVKQYTTQIVASMVIFLSYKSSCSNNEVNELQAKVAELQAELDSIDILEEGDAE